MSLISTIKSWFSSSNEAPVGSTESGKQMFGVVKYYNRSKGYGFIDSQQMKERIFLHISNADAKLKVGDPVEFTLGKNKKGFIAEGVKKVK